ncbi:hypothetical protein [Polymorphum gilvum]|uniref:Orf3, putative exported protein n=1 Tax=Polymorphum gilvum (strain LMG 25793 / CGMCC 1.9160 / SL003B-26A1) TaxID=991905 RepID=F2IXV7_POLGS|nr:hypothetical protein [Polymorphum gilvum]ADZ69438.1 Orf3, putative exported protein [Polymorphum gilvum SL003B-26A1]
MNRFAMVLLVALFGVGPVGAQTAPGYNDYPTAARADYVFACMAVNGRTQDALQRCSCSIDVIASVLPYDDYVSAEAVLRLRNTAGERYVLFRDSQPANVIVAELRRAQAEAEILCF